MSRWIIDGIVAAFLGLALFVLQRRANPCPDPEPVPLFV